jgi:2-keto-3-deoxy-6-phosphogluconate aldolase
MKEKYFAFTADFLVPLVSLGEFETIHEAFQACDEKGIHAFYVTSETEWKNLIQEMSAAL